MVDMSRLDNVISLGDFWYVELNVHMPSRQQSLFDGEYCEPPREKLPTLLQYLKSTKDVTFPLYSRIAYIWLPGSFNNFTLECEKFRVGIGDRNPLYKLLNGNGWGQIITSETAILVSVLDSKGTIKLEESNVYGRYESVGNYGVKFVPTEGAN